MSDDRRPIKRALISVSDKTGLDRLLRCLTRHGISIISSGGTADALRALGGSPVDVSTVTGFPEMMDGRVKTLHPAIHGGLLALREKADHVAAMKAHGIEGIDLLIVNLYPFEETIAKGASLSEGIEKIDIGGPAMIRAAAKNHAHVAVVVDIQDYDALIGALDDGRGSLGCALRQRLAATAFQRTSTYDAAIAAWLHTQQSGEADAPAFAAMSGQLRQTLRYGENPHQKAAFYVSGSARPGVATARQEGGKELSYNNINDTDAAYELVCEFEPKSHAAIAIIKHANPCGVALGATLAEAYARALRCDPVSTFGGIIAANRPLDAQTARAISAIFTEVIIAPDATPEAIEILKAKKNLRLLLAGALPDPTEPGMVFKSVAGGFLMQTRDTGRVNLDKVTCVTERQPTAHELSDLVFAFAVAKHVKSNAIVFARDLATTGIGAGQMNRRDSTRIAAQKGAEAAELAKLPAALTQGSVVASDAFFPFADGLIAAAEAGATAVIQPGGSIRDDEVIAEANRRGLAMVFTGMRHFRH